MIWHNNPQNLVYVPSIKWQGQVGKARIQTIPLWFVKFDTLTSGTRAMIMNTWNMWSRNLNRSLNTMGAQMDGSTLGRKGLKGSATTLHAQATAQILDMEPNIAIPWNKATMKKVILAYSQVEQGPTARAQVEKVFDKAWNLIPAEAKLSYGAYEKVY